MKRFYTLVTVAQDGPSFVIHLDGKPVKTPARAALTTNNKAIANAIMQEWAAQDTEILPDTMPLTQILSTRIDKTAQERSVMEQKILKYFDTDLLFYRADFPPNIGQAQVDAWDPIIQKFQAHFGVTLETTTAIKALIQPPEAHTVVAEYITALDDDYFTILQLVTPLAGSVISGILFTLDQLSPTDIMAIARVEERFKDTIYNAEKYGQDPAAEKADALMLKDLEGAAQYLALIA